MLKPKGVLPILRGYSLYWGGTPYVEGVLPILRGYSLYWGGTPYIEGYSLYWGVLPILRGYSLYWGGTPYIEGVLPILRGYSLYWGGTPYIEGVLPILTRVGILAVFTPTPPPHFKLARSLLPPFLPQLDIFDQHFLMIQILTHNFIGFVLLPSYFHLVGLWSFWFLFSKMFQSFWFPFLGKSNNMHTQLCICIIN